MSSISLAHFRRMLQRLLQRTQEHVVDWFHDEEEDTYVVEFQDGTDISLYYRTTSEPTDLTGAILKLDHKIAATLEAEVGDEGWTFLHTLFQQAQAVVDGSDEEVELIEHALESGQRVGHAVQEFDAVPFNPLERGKKISLEDLTDEDSEFAAEKEA